ncbi:unnamed protein product [Polarella glacialis]|uniref:RING-type domain-containing protein n=1 Tax=Polarella glacialis TaxID=89957 RepID=A0A813DSX8_POLGL|nr:unnamed protein product [Polarella glacialis]
MPTNRKRPAAASEASRTGKRGKVRCRQRQGKGSKKRTVREQLLVEFAAVAKLEPGRGTSRGRAGRRARLLRSLLAIARDLRRKDAAAACSLLIYSEALEPEGLESPEAVAVEAVAARRRLLNRGGRKLWDQGRISGQELLEVLPNASARCLCLLQRLVSLASGRKHGEPSPELAAMALATAAAVLRSDPEGSCAICLEAWSPTARLLVPSCGHTLHVDCFWAMIAGPCSQAMRGLCRTCRRPSIWSPLARSNLRCTLTSAASAAAARCQEAGEAMGPGDFAALCVQFGSEIGDRPSDLWNELKQDLARRSIRGFGCVSSLLSLIDEAEAQAADGIAPEDL